MAHVVAGDLERAEREGCVRGFYFPAVVETRPVSQINKAREEFDEFLQALTSEDKKRQAEGLYGTHE